MFWHHTARSRRRRCRCRRRHRRRRISPLEASLLIEEHDAKISTV